MLRASGVSVVPACAVLFGSTSNKYVSSIGRSAMPHSTRDDVKLSGIECQSPAIRRLTVDCELAADHKEKLVLVLMRMPGKVAFPFCNLHVLIVDTADDLRRPELFEELLCLFEIDSFCGHGRLQEDVRIRGN